MDALVISPLPPQIDTIEIAERKGLGHPDTICDALAETFSRNLCREYRSRFGTILHHNVDKALLVGGRALPQFGAGRVLAPIGIYLAGRATIDAGGETLPIADIAVEGSRAWLRANLHALDPEQHVQIHNLVQPGSQDLRSLFMQRTGGDISVANDTSIGVGYAPISALEQLVLAVERRINRRDRSREHPAWGEDIKVMGIRRGASVTITVACAMISRHLQNLDVYLAEKSALAELVKEVGAQHGFADIETFINSADDPARGAVYLTVTGTSAEAGDDGEVGRGNRVNGLITPSRPMSLEAAAGKNPVTHVGKLYNVLAGRIAQSITSEMPQIAAAQCFLVSRIGAPVTRPAVVNVKLATTDGSPPAELESQVSEIVGAHLARVADLLDEFVAGAIELF
ncbi:MAG TPA: methionine adenosyltransferase [Xanthobacteraceae bacterium]|jgi:S-adenosylmethionine synthetase